MLVTNAIDAIVMSDEEFSEHDQNVKSIVGGANFDDMDISTLITEALSVHPKTKGFKVPDSDFFEYKDEPPSYSNFEEYYGMFFSSTKTLKTDPEWFDFFEAANKLIICNKQFDCKYDKDAVDDNDFIMNQAQSCKNIPDTVQLVYKSENSHKFYNVEINHHAVIMEYGGVDKSSTVDEKRLSIL